MMRCFSGRMPIPVSDTSNDTTMAHAAAWRGPRSAAGRRRYRELTPPSAGDLNALDTKFFKTCCNRFESGDDAAIQVR